MQIVLVQYVAYKTARTGKIRRIFSYLHTRDINRQNVFNVLIVLLSTKQLNSHRWPMYVCICKKYKRDKQNAVKRLLYQLM